MQLPGHVDLRAYHAQLLCRSLTIATRKPPAKPKSTGLDAQTRICVLHGPEQFVKAEHLRTLRNALTEAHGETETFTYNGETASLADVLDELRSYALMQQYKIVLVDNADVFLKKDENYRRAMERYAENPVDHATLVFRCDTWHKSNLDKQIAKAGAVIKCEPMSPAEAKAWLVQRCKTEHGRTLAPAAAAILIERMGTELMPLDSEVAKLALMVEPNEPISRELIEQVVGKSSDEKAWEVQEAVLAGLTSSSSGQLIQKLHELIDLAGHADILVMYFVSDLIRKLNIAALMKRAGANEGVICKELKIWPRERQPLFFGALRKLDGPALSAAFRDALEADRRSKSGLGDTVRNLEGFCVRLADTVE